MMINPPQPGELLREDVIGELGLSVKEAAERLRMSREALSRVLNSLAAISPDLALRLEKAGVSAAREHLATGFPIYYRDRSTPAGLEIKKYPDGRRELVRFKRSGDEVIRPYEYFAAEPMGVLRSQWSRQIHARAALQGQ